MALSFPIRRHLDDLPRLRAAIVAGLPPRARSPRLHLWQMATLPLWFGSDVPPPQLPVRFAPAVPPEATPALPVDRYIHDTLDGLRGRFWFAWWASVVLRGCTLGAVLALVWEALAVGGLAPKPGPVGIVLLMLAGALPGVAFGWLNRPTIPRLATMLDRTFDLDQRLITAVERRERLDDPLETMQLADAANALATIRPEVRRATLVPVREIVLLLVAGMALVATWMATFDRQGIDAVTEANVPGYYPASERLVNQAGPLPGIPTPEPANSGQSAVESGETSDAGQNNDLHDLGALGKAFDQNDMTKQVAGDLASGDIAGAASSLDQAAPVIGAASQADRDALADDLDQAADEMSTENSDLAAQTRKTADAIRSGGAAAEQGVRDLSGAIEQQVPPPPAEGQAGEVSAGGGQQAPVGEQQQGSQNQQSGQSGASGSTGQSGDAAAGSAGQADPGSGVAAEPGIGQESGQGQEQAAGQSGQQQGSQGGDAPGAGAGEQAGSGQDAQQAGSGGGQPGEAAGQPGDTGADGSANNSIGAAQDETSASQGSGAGAGQTGANDNPIEGQDPNTTKSTDGSGQGKAADAPKDVDPGPAPVGESGNSGSASGAGGNTLVIGGSSDDNVQSGNDLGSASLGSGSSGASVASGDANSQPVGPAGPDSNNVPADYEDVVHTYFSEPVP